MLLGLLFTFVALNPLPDLIAYGVTSLVFAVFLKFHRRNYVNETSARAFLYLALGQVMGVVLLFLSPGSRGRRQWLDFPPPPDPVGSYAQQLVVFAREAANPSLAIVLVGATALTLLVAGTTSNRMEHHQEQLKIMTLGFALLALLLVLTGSTNVLLAPGAVWHRWGLQVVVFLLIILCGIWLGNLIHQRVHVPVVVVATMAIVTAISGLLPSLTLNSLVSGRASNWLDQETTLLYIWDRDMFPECWEVLSKPDDAEITREFVPVNPCRDLVP